LITTAVPLKRLAHLNPETLGENTNADHEFRYVDIATVGRGVLVDEPATLTFGSAPSRARRVLQRGDTILSTVRTYLRAVWTLREPDVDFVASTGFVCLRPKPGIDARFLGWLAQADTVVEQVVAESVGVSYPAISPADVGRIKVPCPPPAIQRGIADYLDRETARIDALIAAKRRMMTLAYDQFAAQRDLALTETPGMAWTPLQHLTDPYRPIVYGIVQAGEEVPNGVPYIKTGDLTKFRPELLSRTSREIDRAYQRARVGPGDIVIAMRASIGLPVVVPSELPAANLTQGTARVAPRHNVSLRWLFHALRSRAVQEQCDVRAVGTTFRTLNIWDLRRINIPTPSSFTEQERLADVLDDAERRLNKLTAALASQISLLQEHRQALITALVTGQRDIPEAA
jgi:type I restriction enzyme, S subunit